MTGTDIVIFALPSASQYNALLLPLLSILWAVHSKAIPLVYQHPVIFFIIEHKRRFVRNITNRNARYVRPMIQIVAYSFHRIAYTRILIPHPPFSIRFLINRGIQQRVCIGQRYQSAEVPVPQITTWIMSYLAYPRPWLVHSPDIGDKQMVYSFIIHYMRSPKRISSALEFKIQCTYIIPVLPVIRADCHADPGSITPIGSLRRDISPPVGVEHIPCLLLFVIYHHRICCPVMNGISEQRGFSDSHLFFSRWLSFQIHISPQYQTTYYYE